MTAPATPSGTAPATPSATAPATPPGPAPATAPATASGGATARPRISTYSNAEGGNCVEVAHRAGGVVPVRDTKCPDGPALFFGTRAWAAFVDALKGRRPHAGAAPAEPGPAGREEPRADVSPEGNFSATALI